MDMTLQTTTNINSTIRLALILHQICQLQMIYGPTRQVCMLTYANIMKAKIKVACQHIEKKQHSKSSQCQPTYKSIQINQSGNLQRNKKYKTTSKSYDHALLKCQFFSPFLHLFFEVYALCSRGITMACSGMVTHCVSNMNILYHKRQSWYWQSYSLVAFIIFRET